MREAPSLDLIEAATSEGMKVRAFDPAAEEKARAVLADNPLVEIRDDQYEVLDDADCLAVATDWNQFKNPDFQEIRNRLARPVIFDGRNLWTFEAVREHGLQYFSIGASPVLP
jgi:UDPglucose 6-dehydrogenase